MNFFYIMSKKGPSGNTSSAMPSMAAAVIKLTVGAGAASPAPPVGPALGQKGVKAMEFAKQFNEQTKHYLAGCPLQARIHVNPDKTFSFVTRLPTTSYFLKRVSGLEEANVVGSSSSYVGQITPQQLYEVAKIKSADPSFSSLSLQQVFSMVTNNAREMGLEIVKPPHCAKEA